MIKKLSIILLTLALFSSCNYLDVKPSGQVMPESVSEYRAMLTKAYEAFPQYKYMLAVRSDELFPYSTSVAYDDYVSVALWDETASSLYTPVYPWIGLYTPVFYANSVIAAAMDARVDTKEDSGEQLKAEALLLRAFLHFELVNLYAKPYAVATAATDRGIPIALQIDIEQNYVPSPVAKVYDQIIKDIEDAKELMQVDEQPVSLRYRFSRKSAKALEARVRLYRSEWEQALKAAEELLPCELEDLNDATATLPHRYNSKESILALEITSSKDVENGRMYVLSNIMDKYNLTGDARVGRYFKEVSGKYQPIKGYGDDSKVTFRSAEIYLIAAEAAAHLDGKLETAKGYLKQLMKYRLSPSYYEAKATEVDGMNQQQLIAEIADERARELITEGHRWYDLRRTSRPQMTKTYLDKNKEEKTVTFQENDVRYTVRFPKSATDNNPNLRD